MLLPAWFNMTNKLCLFCLPRLAFFFSSLRRDLPAEPLDGGVSNKFIPLVLAGVDSGDPIVCRLDLGVEGPEVTIILLEADVCSEVRT